MCLQANCANLQAKRALRGHLFMTSTKRKGVHEILGGFADGRRRVLGGWGSFLTL